ncbi:MAG: PAS domain S-box protein, partial [Deltaproteobacteria bacterium]|nr:PAS domain S-box protein [Deltaproteobacteria bacterium]
MERIRRIIETGSGSNFEDSFELPSGQHWFLTNFQPVRGANGEINAMQMISFDITARKRAEEALQQSRKNLKDAQRIARIGNFKWDIDGKVFEWSDEITRIFGVGPEAFNGEVGKIMDAIVPRKDLGMVRDAYEKTFAEGKFRPVEWPLKTPDGKEKFINVEGDLICDEDGKAVAVFGTVQDITERKKVEEELQKARNYIRNIVNSMPSILVGVDPEGTVTQWNLEAEKATGVAASKAQGRALIDVFPLLAGEMAKVKQAMRNRAPQKDTKVAYESDGETRFSDVTVYPLVANGVEGAVIRVDDVTDRVRIEEMMIQSEKMFSVGGLAAGMAHEINNPLAGILQNVQVMKNRMTGDLAKNRHTAEECGTTMAAVESYMEKRGMFRMIEAVMESGKRAARTVDNMLSFSRKSESQFAVHDLCEILDKTVDLADKDYDLKKKYDFRQIEIVRQYEDSLPQVS